MPRKTRPLDRTEKNRDASLIIIASEDTYAVKDYFARFKTQRVQFVVLPTEDGESSPKHVMNRLVRFIRDIQIEDDDTLWLCIDRNGWDVSSLRDVLHECGRRRFQAALSNPCWDFWLLLHFEKPDKSWKPSSRKDVSSRFEELSGLGTGKKLCKTIYISREQVELAMERAREFDQQGSDSISTSPLTQVYKILDELKSKDRIDFIASPESTAARSCERGD
jgi:hypothetical protein